MSKNNCNNEKIGVLQLSPPERTKRDILMNQTFGTGNVECYTPSSIGILNPPDNNDSRTAFDKEEQTKYMPNNKDYLQ